MEVQKFWTKPKIIILISLVVIAAIVTTIILVHRSNLRKKYIALENKINNSVVANHLQIEKIELKDDEYKKISLASLYKSGALSGKNDNACDGYVIAEKGNTKEGIVSKTYITCGSIYTTVGYGSTSTKAENTTVAQSDNDTEPPVVKLNGSETMTIELDSKFEDPSVTAYDNVDKKVSVKTSGKVDTSKEGTYTITYTATDSAGNKASVTRTVIVKKGATKVEDKTPPVITFTKPDTYQTLCIGDPVDVSTDGLYGYVASDDVDGVVTNNVKVEGNNYNGAGTFTLTYRVKDKAGNEGTATRQYTVNDCSQPQQPDPEPYYPPEPDPEPDPEPSGGGGGGTPPSGGTATVNPSGISVDDTVYVSVGGTTNLNASVQPSNASDKSLSYTVSNSNIATVDGSGNVHGKKKGETRVTIRTSNGIEKGVYIIVE